MADRSKTARRWLILGAVGLTVLLVAAVAIWRDDILRTSLDPQVPFQTYRPPPKPDYARRSAWTLLPTRPGRWTAADPPADVFFVSPTTYDGGSEWNARINDPRSDRYFRRSIAPNYAAPFLRTGRIFAPRYRQASLYTLLTLREDARDARRFAYGDVAAAFRLYRDRYNQGRPFVLVGVEQGGLLASRILAEEIMPDPALRRRLAAAYLIETVAPVGGLHAPGCATAAQTGCLAAWATKVHGDHDRGQDLVDRALVWGANGQLESLGGRAALCFNPILHAATAQPAATRQNLGAANATGLEWGARPAFLTRQVSAQCQNGVLRVSRPKSALLRPAGSWADRRKVASYNLFWADIEADAKTRVAALIADPAFPKPALLAHPID
jgi:hypothetical protein